MSRSPVEQAMLADLEELLRANPPPPSPAPELIVGRYRVTSDIVPGEHRREEQGIDTSNGAPVLLRPAAPRGLNEEGFVTREKIETTARIVASIGGPWLLPVLLATPRVVYAAPPAATRPDIPLATADAVECLLQLCDVLARLHAAGIVGIDVDVPNLRVDRREGAWRIAVVLPPLSPRSHWAAYHQRAVVALGRGDHEAAARDLEQAISLDPWARHLVTRGVLRASRGDHEGALSDYEAAVAAADAEERRSASSSPTDGFFDEDRRGPDLREAARAHYARGVARHRKGDEKGAKEDIQSALDCIEALRRRRLTHGSPPDASLDALESVARRVALR